MVVSIRLSDGAGNNFRIPYSYSYKHDSKTERLILKLHSEEKTLMLESVKT